MTSLKKTGPEKRQPSESLEDDVVYQDVHVAAALFVAPGPVLRCRTLADAV